jgi:predicted metal-dependent hydrolase
VSPDDFHIALPAGDLAVRVRRHHASRRLRLRYDPISGDLKLTMPPRQRLSSARAWVEQQQPWIATQLAKRPAIAPPVGPGSLLPWRGEELTVVWDAGYPRQPHVDGGELRCGGPIDSVGPRIRRWLMALARTDFTQRTHAMAMMAGVTATGIAVGDPRSRWGSCSSSGNIRYNWRLILAPDCVRHALVAHEVAHLVHLNHGPAFHALADRLGGAANAQSKAWLKQHGASLHAIRFA